MQPEYERCFKPDVSPVEPWCRGLSPCQGFHSLDCLVELTSLDKGYRANLGASGQWGRPKRAMRLYESRRPKAHRTSITLTKTSPSHKQAH